MDRFRENIEIWFNDGMDRVSGWYKRRIMYIQALIAMGLALAMNIDANDGPIATRILLALVLAAVFAGILFAMWLFGVMT